MSYSLWFLVDRGGSLGGYNDDTADFHLRGDRVPLAISLALASIRRMAVPLPAGHKGEAEAREAVAFIDQWSAKAPNFEERATVAREARRLGSDVHGQALGPWKSDAAPVPHYLDGIYYTLMALEEAWGNSNPDPRALNRISEVLEREVGRRWRDPVRTETERAAAESSIRQDLARLRAQVA